MNSFNAKMKIKSMKIVRKTTQKKVFFGERFLNVKRANPSIDPLTY